MNPRQLIIAWVTAIGLVAILSIALVVLADRAARSQKAEIVVIGTSLMAYAVPASGTGATSLLGDGRSHIRIAAPLMSESNLLTRLERAIDQRAALVLVEVNPLLFDFADQAHQRPCDGLSFKVRAYLAAEYDRVPAAYRQLTGRVPKGVFPGDPYDLAAAHALDPAVARKSYPLVLHAPCDEARLAAAVARARAQATRVVLVLPPRSPDADRLVGDAVTAELRHEAAAMAARLGAELFVVKGNWPNGEFVDAAHVNKTGRAHFVRDLRRWWAGAQ